MITIISISDIDSDDVSLIESWTINYAYGPINFKGKIATTNNNKNSTWIVIIVAVI